MKNLRPVCRRCRSELVPGCARLAPPLQVIQPQARKAIQQLQQNIFLLWREWLPAKEALELTRANVEQLEYLSRAGRWLTGSGGCQESNKATSRDQCGKRNAEC